MSTCARVRVCESVLDCLCVCVLMLEYVICALLCMCMCACVRVCDLCSINTVMLLLCIKLLVGLSNL